MAYTAQQADGLASSERLIRFRKPFADSYTLNIETHIQAGSFPLHTKARIRWALRIMRVDENRGQADLELITIENQLLETNNPNLHDIAALNQAFARMYSEIQVRLDHKGKILEVLNLPVILGKWQETKAAMAKIEADAPAIAEVVKLNDDIFASPDKVKLAIEHNEFFGIYFHLIYGEKIPTDELRRTHRNLFNSVDVNWRFSATATRPADGEDHSTKIKITGAPVDDLDRDWIKKAYASFEMVDASQINPRLSETGDYLFETETGKLLEAVLIKEENAHPQYIRGKMTYELKSDVQTKNDAGSETNESFRQPPVNEPPRKYFWEREDENKF